MEFDLALRGLRFKIWGCIIDRKKSSHTSVTCKIVKLGISHRCIRLCNPSFQSLWVGISHYTFRCAANDGGEVTLWVIFSRAGQQRARPVLPQQLPPERMTGPPVWVESGCDAVAVG